MGDAVDLIAAAWRRERPDVDVAPMEIIGRLTRLGRLIDLEQREYFARHGLERWEFDVLATLRRSGGKAGLTAGDLNKAAMVTSGAITNRIDRLAAKDLVQRTPDPDDRRAIRVQLTATGRTLIDELLAPHIANEERLLATLPPADRTQLAALLRTLCESLGDTALS